MEIGEILEKLKTVAAGGVQKKGRFGRSEPPPIWVEARVLPTVVQLLKNDAELSFDWLENLSAAEVDGAIALTYFLRSTTHPHRVILRAMTESPSPSKTVDFISVAECWMMATPFESEIQELFGVRFVDARGGVVYDGPQRLPAGWHGYPMRKNYVFPTEFLGLSHARRPHGREGNT